MRHMLLWSHSASSLSSYMWVIITWACILGKFWLFDLITYSRHFHTCRLSAVSSYPWAWGRHQDSSYQTQPSCWLRSSAFGLMGQPRLEEDAMLSESQSQRSHSASGSHGLIPFSPLLDRFWLSCLMIFWSEKTLRLCSLQILSWETRAFCSSLYLIPLLCLLLP